MKLTHSAYNVMVTTLSASAIIFDTSNKGEILAKIMFKHAKSSSGRLNVIVHFINAEPHLGSLTGFVSHKETEVIKQACRDILKDEVDKLNDRQKELLNNLINGDPELSNIKTTWEHNASLIRNVVIGYVP